MLHRADGHARQEAGLPPLVRASARSPWDSPLSSRFDENDAVVVFDDAFIPWENVLVYRDVEKATGFYAQSGFMPRYTLQAGTRLAVKLDFLCGLLARAWRRTGRTASAACRRSSASSSAGAT